MNEVATLIKRTYDGAQRGETKREVLCGFRSIGQREFYQANATDFHPELKLVLADYLDYDNETLVDYDGRRYRVIRTYRIGLELELTLERASAEDGEADG
ncbi:MAG: phage head-tail adapter protein [Ruminococcaceae bacterium]|nr:phage head-tail adapter protein [Oscillospiraceae bacterium]